MIPNWGHNKASDKKKYILGFPGGRRGEGGLLRKYLAARLIISQLVGNVLIDNAADARI